MKKIGLSENAAPVLLPPPAFSRRWQLAVLASGFVLFLAGLVGALALATRGAQLSQAGRRQVAIERTASDLLGAVLECESSQRGYLLTQDETYLRPYLVTRVQLESMMRDLTGLADDEPQEEAEVAKLRPLVDSKLGELEATVNLEQRALHAQALSVVNADRGMRLMAQVRDEANALMARAEERLNHYRTQIDGTSAWLRADIVATLVVAIFVLAFVGRTRTQFIRDLALQNAQLEERVRERTQALEERSKRVETLMQDMSHRVGNALSLVTGFLDLQARASKSEEVKTALASARQRVFSIASAQRRMRLAMDSDTVEANEFFGALIEDFRNSLPDVRIAIEANIRPGRLPSQDAAAFGVIINELIANAIKHAWGPGDTGRLAVSFDVREGERVLSVCDDGRGDERADSSGGLGQILVESLVQSLRGEMASAPAGAGERPGLCVTVRAPA